MSFSVPVLLVIFNRPALTRSVMDAIRLAKPSRLYVAADGPRDGAGEAVLCQEARDIATEVNWPCELVTRFRGENVGCRIAVSSAIDWFFQHEEEGIILEDDCLPSLDFFRFCDELLPRYRAEAQVMAICGSCYTDSTFDSQQSYYFSYYADMWGWATWRRAWRLYDRNLSRWPAFKRERKLRAIVRGAKELELAWSHFFDRTAAHEIDTWDFQWIYTIMEQGGVACYPVRNLVLNLGFTESATHTRVEAGSDPGPLAHRRRHNLKFPLKHPVGITRSYALEEELEHLRLHYLKDTYKRLKQMQKGAFGRAFRRRLKAAYRSFFRVSHP